MNHAMVCYLVGWMLSVEGGILLLPLSLIHISGSYRR